MVTANTITKRARENSDTHENCNNQKKTPRTHPEIPSKLLVRDFPLGSPALIKDHKNASKSVPFGAAVVGVYTATWGPSAPQPLPPPASRARPYQDADALGGLLSKYFYAILNQRKLQVGSFWREKSTVWYGNVEIYCQNVLMQYASRVAHGNIPAEVFLVRSVVACFTAQASPFVGSRAWS